MGFLDDAKDELSDAVDGQGDTGVDRAKDARDSLDGKHGDIA